ncbi:MAG: cell division protein FtsZ [Solirubrobacterales bacterium]
MREGPLAALFRRTDVPGDEQPQQPQERGPDVRPEIDEPPAIPTPKERLTAAFSQDIPSDVLEPPDDSPREYRPRDEPLTSRPASVHMPVLRVVGVGGAGVNAVNRMIEAGVEGVEFIAVNTDLQSLHESAADITLHIGGDITRGLGSGSDPNIGHAAAVSDDDRIKTMLKGSDMVFVTSGAGGGTGTGAAPIVARIAREVGALTVGIVTKPFGFEGTKRMAAAEEGVKELAKQVDTLIVIPNNRLLSVLEQTTTMVDAFRVADDVLRQGVQGVSDLVTLPGLINLDFADVRTIMSDAGQALLGIGMGTGERRSIEAAEQAVSSPLLETSVEGARSILLSITGGPDLSLWEVNEAAKAVSEAAHPGANIIFGAMVDEKISDECWVTVVATGYGDRSMRGSTATRLHEPAGEPRVRRTERSNVRDLADELEIPEFIPGR